MRRTGVEAEAHRLEATRWARAGGYPLPAPEESEQEIRWRELRHAREYGRPPRVPPLDRFDLPPAPHPSNRTGPLSPP